MKCEKSNLTPNSFQDANYLIAEPKGRNHREKKTDIVSFYQ
jgi:hypothetical protein